MASTTGIQRRTTVYNFEVEDFHTYFVGQSAAWVHNRYEDEIEDLDDRIKKLKEEEAGASGKRKRELRDEQKKLREQKAELERQNGEAGDAPDQADGTPPADVPPSRGPQAEPVRQGSGHRRSQLRARRGSASR